MQRNILVLFVMLVMSVGLGFAFTTSLTQTVTAQQTQGRVEQEAIRLYRTLSSLSMSSRRSLFNALTPELKSELWKVHLRSYLSKHPDFTEQQRDTIQSAIALITPQLYEIPKDSPEWQTNVHEPLQRLTQKFLEVFPREVARELLTVLGGPDPQQESNPVLIKRNSLTFKPIARSVTEESCSCSTSTLSG